MPILWGGGGGARGPNLPPPVACNPGSRPFFPDFLPSALFRLRNIIQCCVISPYFSRFPPFWNSHLPPFPLPPRTPPAAYSPGLPPPCPPPPHNLDILIFNFFIFRYAKVNEFISLSKNPSYLCFILAGELFGAFGN